MFKNKPFLLIVGVGASMAAIAAYAAIPGVFTPAPIKQYSPHAGVEAQGELVDVGEGVGVFSSARKTDDAPPPMQLAQISAVPQSLNPIAYGDGETGENLDLAGKASRPQEDYVAPIGPAAIARSESDDQECVYDQYGKRQAVPLEKLVLIIRSGIAAAGAIARIDDLRTLIQSDLNRSGDDQKIKVEALQQLISLYPPSSVASRALQQPFDLADLGFTEVNGYDPCSNPAATGPSGFGRGPFADTFSTINPMPVVKARTLAVTEGGGGG